MTTALVLCAADRAPQSGVDRPGGALPYGLARLTASFDVVWPGAHPANPVVALAARAADGVARRAAPGWRGSGAAMAARARASETDVALAVFEDVGMVFARGRRRVPLVMLCCWLAEDAHAMSAASRASVGRALAATERICVYSANQLPILADAFGIDAERARVIPFGVDVDYYSASRVDATSGGGGILAVGSDSRRDYATLFEASRRSGLPLTVLCQPRNLEGLSIPPGVRIGSAYGDDYRRWLHRADVVVTSTTAPAYPSGQTVVLEAMAMGRATVTTDSAAMREYVSAGDDGLLVPPGDPEAVAQMLAALMADESERGRLGARAAAAVRARFSSDIMWDAAAVVLREALEDRDAKPDRSGH